MCAELLSFDTLLSLSLSLPFPRSPLPVRSLPLPESHQLRQSSQEMGLVVIPEQLEALVQEIDEVTACTESLTESLTRILNCIPSWGFATCCIAPHLLNLRLRAV